MDAGKVISHNTIVPSDGGVLLPVERFEVDSHARLLSSGETIDSLDTKKVLVFIDHDNRIIYLWRGRKADVVKKLVGTRVAAKLSHTYPDYRIRPIGEGSEPAAFKALLVEK